MFDEAFMITIILVSLMISIRSEHFSLISFTTKFSFTFIYIVYLSSCGVSPLITIAWQSSLQKCRSLTPVAFMQYFRCPVKRLTSSTVELL